MRIQQKTQIYMKSMSFLGTTAFLLYTLQFSTGTWKLSIFLPLNMEPMSFFLSNSLILAPTMLEEQL